MGAVVAALALGTSAMEATNPARVDVVPLDRDFPSRRGGAFNVRDFGAKGNGQANDTAQTLIL